MDVLDRRTVAVRSIVLHGLATSSTDSSLVLEPVDHSVKT